MSQNEILDNAAACNVELYTMLLAQSHKSHPGLGDTRVFVDHYTLTRLVSVDPPCFASKPPLHPKCPSQ